MIRRSLRLRLFIAALLCVAAALAVAGVLLTQLFERHVTRHYDGELQSFLRQLIAAVEIAPDGTISLNRQLEDARFGEPLSGLYWQIGEDKTGFLLGSRSLWDSHIPLPRDVVAPGAVDSHVLIGPKGAPVRVQERVVVFDQPGGSHALRMAVAMDMAEIDSARRAFAADLWPSMTVIGLLLLAATWIYIGIGLRPLDAIRKSLNDVRTGAARRLEGDFPAEVTPLVEEANALLTAQDESLAKARARATDLAHGLKTPLAVLQSDAERLRARGESEIADEMASLARQMGRHVQRELTRARMRGGETLSSTPLLPVVERLVASLRRTPAGHELAWSLAIPESLTVAADAEDLTEILGNLLDNACKWARHAIRVEASASGDRIRIHVLDDGAGVPEEALVSLAGRGVRLDQNVPGTGLGLAIARDIAQALEGALHLANRAEGGFSATVELFHSSRSKRHA
jgi:signal transduction histidine kinase